MAGGFGHVKSGLGEAGAFELDGGVRDVEFAGEHVANLSENFFAFFHVHVGDAEMAGEGVEICAERPDVNVVDFLDAFDT